MALGINTEGGSSADIIPIVKYDARAGRAVRVDRTNTGAGWAAEPVDITSGFKAVFDMENIEVGWMCFNTGGAPDFKLAPLGTSAGEKPSDNHREGFRLMLKLGKESGGDTPVRELSSVAKVVIRGFNKLHDAYLAGVKENAGKLPVVALKASTPVVSGAGLHKSTNYEPVFEITGWTARPADLVFRPKSNGASAATAPKPADVSPETIAAAMADAEDFG